MTRRMIHLATKLATASASSRTITGVATTYGQQASASTGPVIIEAGSLHWADDLSRLKLLVDHDQTQPVGYATAVTDSDAELTITFHVPEGDDGDRALTQASNGLRDGLSVGVWMDDDGYTLDADGYVHVMSGMLREVSLCALPAIDDARVSDVAATAHHGRNTMTEENTAPAAPAVAATGTAPTPAAPPAPAPAPVQQAAPVTPPGPSGRRSVSLSQAARITSDIIHAGGSAADVRAALADVTPASLPAEPGQEDAFLRDTWLGQLWSASRVERPWFDLPGTPRDITGLKVYGRRWAVKPQVGPYTGNKAEIPTNVPKIEIADSTPERTAGGWDIDRIYVDLGDASLVEELWIAAVEDYMMKSEAKTVVDLKAEATVVAASPSFTAALTTLGRVAGQLGARISQVGLGSDIWDDFAGLTKDEVPWWLGNGDSINIGETTGTVGGVKFFVDPNLDADEYLAADRRGYTSFEKNPPVRVNAIDLAHGGVDLGLFGYHDVMVNDARTVLTGTVTPPVVEPEA
jgi:HK97 family phage prohead protease